MPLVTTAAYQELAIATLVVRTLEAAGIASDAIHLFAPPGLVPAQADLTTRDGLMRLGVPANESQILADMTQGGAVILAVETASEGEAFDRAVAALEAARPSEPVATFDASERHAVSR